MGYMSLSVFGSDTCSDFASRCVEAIAKEMKKEINQDHSQWNTPGVINVGILISEVIYPVRRYCHSNDLIYRMAKHVVQDIDATLESAKNVADSVWRSEEDKKWFFEEQDRLKRDVLKYIRYCEKQRPEIKGKDSKSKRSKKS
jgi:hypothetical protein